MYKFSIKLPKRWVPSPARQAKPTTVGFLSHTEKGVCSPQHWANKSDTQFVFSVWVCVYKSLCVCVWGWQSNFDAPTGSRKVYACGLTFYCSPSLSLSLSLLSVCVCVCAMWCGMCAWHVCSYLHTICLKTHHGVSLKIHLKCADGLVVCAVCRISATICCVCVSLSLCVCVWVYNRLNTCWLKGVITTNGHKLLGSAQLHSESDSVQVACLQSAGNMLANKGA